MTGHIGFSYIGAVFLVMLFVPNILWTRKMPEGYTAAKENKILQFLERIGEVLTCCCALLFSDFNWHEWSVWTWWLIAACILMIMYELWWARYFKSERKLTDFYSSFCKIPLAGATLPVFAFFLLGIYGKIVWMLISTVILGIGHIGIHMQHSQESKRL